MNEYEVELSDGGCIEFDPEDGTIRWIDVWGNCEGKWKVGEEEYDQYKKDYFPNVEVEDNSE